MAATAEQVQQAMNDADKLAEAAAILLRRYPNHRPDFLDDLIAELRNIASGLRRHAEVAMQS